MKTLDISEAAEFLKISQYQARTMASAGKLPAAKIGKRWVFVLSDLERHVQNEIKIQTASASRSACLQKQSSRPGRPARHVQKI